MIDVIQNKINKFVFTYFYPVLALRAKRGRISESKKDISPLLLKLNIPTISERRILSLLRFICKELKLCLFKYWFIRTPSADDDCNIVRLQLPKFLSERYKQSIKYSAIIIWNQFVQVIKPLPKTE